MILGLFDKLKNVFKKEKDIEIYDKGLEKTSNELNSKFNFLSRKYKKITDAYFEELEEALIMADIGVNTVMSFVDKLRHRVKNESITDTEMLKEIIVDELLIMYVGNNVVSSKIDFTNKPTVILFVGVNGVG